MNINIVMGQLLLWTGFLSGALATVIQLENSDAPWSSINWYWYAASILAGVGGIIILRKGRKVAGHRPDGRYGLKQTRSHLDNLVLKTERLHAEHAQQKPRQTLEFIDEQLADDFREFAEGRNSITREFGLAAFAEVMTEFAAGERTMNRAWSASADGYVEEAADCIERALQRLRAAQAALAACRK